MPSVLQDWVTQLALAKQGTLLTAVRGPDNVRKDHPVKTFVRAYRRAVLNGAKKTPNDFMASSPIVTAQVVWQLARNGRSVVMPGEDESLVGGLLQFWSAQVDDVPHHWLMHFCHCAEIIGYDGPAEEVCSFWSMVYHAIVESFHMSAETEEHYLDRLRDRGCF